uniref:hypothetical protein n=1 Tax=Stylonema alsidii TaxID=35155 RepID=UPI001FCDC67D|nr:hypothetical protein MW559_pgp094 [Stylonema alsidii]UNJ15198.1 hypothetical protein [Stylonema alsidii]
MYMFVQQKVQFYRTDRNITFEIISRVGQIGIIVGHRQIAYSFQSYIVEFPDNIRIWLLPEEIRVVSN